MALKKKKIEEMKKIEGIQTEEMGEMEEIPALDKTALFDPCNAWCFLLGPAFKAFCPLSKGHEEDHRIEINIFAEPRSHFTISWSMDD